MKGTVSLILSSILLFAKSPDSIKYFNSESDFLSGIEFSDTLFYHGNYLKVHTDEREEITKKYYHNNRGELKKYELFYYDSTTRQLHRIDHFDANNILVKQFRFGKQEKYSTEFIQYIYRLDHIRDFGDRMTEIVFRKDKQPSEILFRDANKSTYGKISFLYDGNGIKRQEDWITLPKEIVKRRFQYNYNQVTELTELFEYDSLLFQVNHIFITNDGRSPLITVEYPTDSSIINGISLIYSLFENLDYGEIIWERIGGNLDAHSPHVSILTEKERRAGKHHKQVKDSPVLTSSSIYDVTFKGIGKSGYPAIDIALKNVMFDDSPPLYQLNSNKYINSPELTFSSNEPIAIANIKFESLDLSKDSISTKTVTFVADAGFSIGQTIDLVNKIDMEKDGVYSIEFIGWDFAGNMGEKIILEEIHYDVSPPSVEIIFPQENGFTADNRMEFILSESVSKGWFRWSNIDSGDSVILLEGSLPEYALNSGRHALLPTTDSSFQFEDGLFKLQIGVTDFSGNESVPSVVSNIKIDNTIPEIQLYEPIGESYTNEFNLRYELSEDFSMAFIEIISIDSSQIDSERLGKEFLVKGYYELEDFPLFSEMTENLEYTVKFTGADLAGNSSNIVLIEKVQFDTQQPIVKFLSLDDGMTILNPGLSYSLSETLNEGTIFWVWSGGEEDQQSPHEINLTEELLLEGIHALPMKLLPELQDGSQYTVTFFGSDFAGNAGKNIPKENIKFDVSAPTLKLSYPKSNSLISSLELTYTNNEDLKTGSIIWEAIDGEPDSYSPHTSILTDNELLEGIHQSIVLGDSPTLLDGVVYQIKFEGQDFAGNSSESVKVTHVSFDGGKPEIVFLSPQNNYLINYSEIKYKLSETVESLEIVWEEMSGNQDTLSPHIFKFPETLKKFDKVIVPEGRYANQQVTIIDLSENSFLCKLPGGMRAWIPKNNIIASHQKLVRGEHVLNEEVSLKDGATYRIYATAVDKAGNESDIISVENIQLDLTKPEIDFYSLTSNSVISSNKLSYRLSENLDEGYLTWTWAGGTPDELGIRVQLLTEPELIVGDHSSVILQDSVDLVNAGIYNLYFEGNDKAGNLTDFKEIEEIVFDVSSPEIVVENPISKSIVNSSLVTYSLSENFASMEIYWTNVLGKVDLLSPHKVELTGHDLSEGIHQVQLSESLPLQDSSYYTLTFYGLDLGGNPSDTVKLDSIFYDITPPAVDLIYPVEDSVVDDKMLSFSNSEKLSELFFTFERISGLDDNLSPHQFDIDQEYFDPGLHEEVMKDKMQRLQVGTSYQISGEGKDRAGNTVTIENVDNVEIIRSLLGNWIYKGVILQAMWTFGENNKFSQGVLMGSRISQKESGIYRIDFTKKPFEFEIHLDSGEDQYAWLEFTGPEKIRVVVSKNPPESWTDGDIMDFEYSTENIP